MKNIKIKNLGDKLAGISFEDAENNVSFIVYKEDVEKIMKKLKNKESFSIKSFSGKDIIFAIANVSNNFIVLDVFTGNIVEFNID